MEQRKVTARGLTTRQDEEFSQGVHEFHASIENERGTTAMGFRPVLMSHVVHDPAAQSRESVLDMPLESESYGGFENLDTSQFMASVDSNIPEQRLSPISFGEFFQDTQQALSSPDRESQWDNNKTYMCLPGDYFPARSMEFAPIAQMHALDSQDLASADTTNEVGAQFGGTCLDSALASETTASMWYLTREPGCHDPVRSFYKRDQKPFEAAGGGAPFAAPKIQWSTGQGKGKSVKDSREIQALINKEREALRTMHQQVLHLQMKIFRQQQQLVMCHRHRMQAELCQGVESKNSLSDDTNCVSPALTRSHVERNSKPTGRKCCRPSRGWRKSKGASGKPKRPLTAYNIFFQHERARMLGLAQADIIAANPDEHASSSQVDFDAARMSTYSNNEQSSRVSLLHHSPSCHKRVGFAEMAQRISQMWRSLEKPTLEKYLFLASEDKKRYMAEKAAYLKREQNRSSGS